MLGVEARSASNVRAHVAGLQGGQAQSLEVTGEFTGIRIPAGPDDADNYITGARHLSMPAALCLPPTRNRSVTACHPVTCGWRTCAGTQSCMSAFSIAPSGCLHVTHAHARLVRGGSRADPADAAASCTLECVAWWSCCCTGTGLAVDLTSVQVPVLHPNPEKGNLPPSPVLIVATSDGQLRFFTLGSTAEADAGIVQPRRPVPEPAYLQRLSPEVSSAAVWGSCQQWQASPDSGVQPQMPQSADFRSAMSTHLAGGCNRMGLHLMLGGPSGTHNPEGSVRLVCCAARCRVACMAEALDENRDHVQICAGG